jgi:hypothetical protein
MFHQAAAGIQENGIAGSFPHSADFSVRLSVYQDYWSWHIQHTSPKSMVPAPVNCRQG